MTIFFLAKHYFHAWRVPALGVGVYQESPERQAGSPAQNDFKG